MPYATVIDINPEELPSADEVETWDAQHFARTMRHDPSDPLFNPSFRQLIHVSYKIAAELGDEFYPALEEYADAIGKEIEANLCERHVSRLFSL